MYYCDTLHTSICFPYNGGHRRGLQTHLMLSARFLERIFQSDHYLFAPPTGSLKINTNRTLFSSTNFGEHIYLNLVLYYSPLTLYVKRMIQICTITFIYSFYSCALFLLFIRNLCCLWIRYPTSSHVSQSLSESSCLVWDLHLRHRISRYLHRDRLIYV